MNELEQRVQHDAQAQIDEMRRASKADGAWAHCLVNVWLNGKKLVDSEANRNMMENMLQPHEQPNAAIYKTVALSYPAKFSWEAPQPVQSDAERRTEFEATCKQHALSLCSANEQLHKDGIGIEHWAGASQVEIQKFQLEAAQARQKFLIHNASPSELRAEAAHEFAAGQERAMREDAEQRHQQMLSQQSHYPPLPLSVNGEAWDAKFFRKISTTNYPLFKQIVRKYGCGNVTDRLRQN